MRSGAKYVDQAGKEWKIYFPIPRAALPVYRGDQVEWVRWGCRRKELAAGFVQSGWARHDSILAGKWKCYASEFVQLAAIAFMDAARVSHWIDVPAGMAIEALIVCIDAETRLYVVTEDTPEDYSWVHDRWPRLQPRRP